MKTVRTTKSKASTQPASNVVSLADFKDKHDGRRSSRRKTSRYHYPKSLLVQAYFDQGGYGDWREPRFTLKRLGSSNFQSPLGALLDQLEAEGHNVQGARIEWLAFRDLAKQYSEMFFDLVAVGKESTVAAHLFASPPRRKP